MIDSHCHVGIGPEWGTKASIDNLLSRAREAGVKGILTVACSFTDLADFNQMILRQNVWGSFGIHPEHSDLFDKNSFLETVKKYPDLVAIGEIGLDYFYCPEKRESQINAFEQQIEIAHLLDLPIIIHTREAEDDTIRILQTAARRGLLERAGVLHCFTGSRALCEAALELGFYISASGIITFRKATELRDVFQNIPLNRLLVETDSPYLAPVPYRGKTNEPSYVVETAKQLALIKEVTLSEIDEITTHNFKKLFRIKDEI